MNAIPFMKWRWLAVALSATAMLAAIASLSLRQLHWGLDFTGGTLIEVEYSDSADLIAIRSILDQEGYQGAVVVSFGTDRDVLEAIEQQLTSHRLLKRRSHHFKRGFDTCRGGARR